MKAFFNSASTNANASRVLGCAFDTFRLGYNLLGIDCVSKIFKRSKSRSGELEATLAYTREKQSSAPMGLDP